MSIYQFRAECRHDVDVLFRNIFPKIKDAKICQEFPFPDVDVEIVTDLSLDDLRNEMRAVPDGYVMLETVAPSDEYTGERYYSPW